MELPYKLQIISKKIADNIFKHSICEGRRPTSIAGAAIKLAHSFMYPESKDKAFDVKLSHIAKISNKTLQHVFKELICHHSKLTSF
jgi:transcription initiation factor TFIIIB Brf1 subunit/transcription initiation factor TFIIB